MTEEEIFNRAIDLPPEEREAFLRAACGDDDALRESVESLLTGHEGKNVLLDTPLSESKPASSLLRDDGEPDLDEELPLSPLGEEPMEFGDYKLEKEIARGAMGVVYRAEQTSLKRTVAIKMIRSAMLASEEDFARFKGEAEAAAGLDHPNIVPIYEVGEHEEQHFFSMKLIEGGTLTEAMESLREDPKAAAKLMATVARAIHVAHQHGILHRDLKPGNILIDGAGEPHVTDFGLAKQMESNSSMTMSGRIMGTPFYMAPEQAEGGAKELTTGADLYSLGAMLYQVITGSLPHKGESLVDTLKLVVEEEPVAPRRIDPSISRDLETIVLKCLHKDPDKRYPSAAGLADDLERWLRGEPVLARPVGGVEKLVKWVRRKPVLAAFWAGTALFFLTVGIGGPIVAIQQSRLKMEATRARDGAEEVSYWATMEAAFAYLEAGRHYDIYKILQMSPAHLRDWEWHYLHDAVDNSTWSFRLPDQDVRYALFRDKGKTVMLVSGEGVVTIVDRATRVMIGEPVQLPAPPFVINSTGTHFLLRGPETYDLWEIESARVVQSFPSFRSSVGQNDKSYEFVRSGAYLGASRRYAISPDGTHVVTLTPGNPYSVTLYEVGQSEPVRTLPSGIADGCAFSPDGSTLVWSAAGKISFLDLKSATEARPPIDGADKWLKLNAKNTLLARNGASLRIHDLESGKMKELSKGFGGGFAFMPDGERIVRLATNGRHDLWNARSGSLIRRFGFRHGGDFTFGAHSRHGNEVLIPSEYDGDTEIRVWNPDRPDEFVIREHGLFIYGVATNHDGSLIASGSWDKSARTWDGRTGRELMRMEHDRPVQDLALHPNGQRMVTVAQDVNVRLWDTTTGRLLAEKEIYSGAFQTGLDLHYLPDGRGIILVAHDTVHRLDPDTLEVAARARPGLTMRQAAVDPTGDFIVTAEHRGYTSTLTLRDPDSLAALATTPLPTMAGSLAVGPRGQLIAVGFSAKVGVWRSDDLENPLWVESGHAGEVFDVVFNSDGSRLFSGARDGQIRIWASASGQSFGVLRGHTDYVYALDISGDGTRLVSGSGDHTIRVWDAKPAREPARDAPGK